MRRCLRNIGGYEVKTEGDAFIVTFKNAEDALKWCFTIQMQLLDADWPQEVIFLLFLFFFGIIISKFKFK